MSPVVFFVILCFAVVALGFFALSMVIGNKTYQLEGLVIYKITLELASCDDKTEEVRQICRQITNINHTLQHNYFLLERNGIIIRKTKEEEEEDKQRENNIRKAELRHKLETLQKQAKEVKQDLKKLGDNVS